MTDNIAVVKPAYAEEKAYRMGFKRFEGMDTFGEFDFGPFTDGAEWANNILPQLRTMAGFSDAGHGTYQMDRKVAAVVPGCEEDEPAEAELTQPQLIFNELVDAYRAGAYDAADGREPDVSNI